jgi:hypothetical protein
MKGPVMGEAAAILRQVLASIAADEIEATEQQRAYLEGSADALERVSVSSY